MSKKKSKKLAITQVRSGIGRPPKHRRTLAALGIKHHQQTVVHEDTPQIRGMVAQIPHLLAVKEIEG
jgi:large subunit ribosomal protein L30